MPSDLSVSLCGVRLRNPTVLPSGIVGTSAGLLKRAADEGAGAVTTKSVCLKPRAGNKNPSVVAGDFFVLNAVGLPSPGVDAFVSELQEARNEIGAPLIASVFGSKPSEFGEVASRVSEVKPELIEANISCPNVESEFGVCFAAKAETAAEVTRTVKDATDIPVFVKLSPNVASIKEIALAVEKAGADGITAINTVAAMAIDLETGKPVLANKVGGLSGQAIKPVALKCVYDVCGAVEIPVIACGGISSGEDALEFVMAGATAVGIGSAVYSKGPSVFRQVCGEMDAWLEKHGHKSLGEVKGITLK